MFLTCGWGEICRGGAEAGSALHALEKQQISQQGPSAACQCGKKRALGSIQFPAALSARAQGTSLETLRQTQTVGQELEKHRQQQVLKARCLHLLH